jgi:hypothetical protein
MMPKICRYIVLNLSLLFCFYLKGYSSDIDSLKRLLNTSMADSVKVDVLNSLSILYFNDKPDTSIVIAASASIMAEKILFSALQHPKCFSE